jgi:hypothetical protein
MKKIISIQTPRPTLALCFLVLYAGSLLPGCGQKQEPAFSAVNDGLPRTPAQLNAWYIEPAQNAAESYLQGFDAMHMGAFAVSDAPILGKGRMPPLSDPLAPYSKSSLAAIVRANNDALKWFAQGAGIEQCRYPVDLNLGFEAVFPHIVPLKKAALLAEAAAVLHAEANDGKQAANDVLVGLGLARSFEAEPALLSQVFRAASVSTAVSGLERVMNRTVLPKDSLAELKKSLQKMEIYDAEGEGFKRAIVSERVNSLALLAAPQKMLVALATPDVPADLRVRGIARVQKGGNFNAEEHYIEATFHQILTAREKAFPDRFKSDEIIRLRSSEPAAKKLVLVQVLLQGLGGRVAQEAKGLASLRLGLTAVALEQFRAAHDDRYPTALTELTPDYLSATPVDPFDGQPLRYGKKGSGYWLYSIGPDLSDDSGKRMSDKDGDIVFAVVAPPKQG